MAKAEVVLELSGIEAGVLLVILRHVGGNPDGPRGAADSVGRALKRLGVEPVGVAQGAIEIEGHDADRQAKKENDHA